LLADPGDERQAPTAVATVHEFLPRFREEESSKPMRTAGIDLSSQDRKSAACVMEWSGHKAEIVRLDVNVSTRSSRA
jgi:hypothetical protein